MVFPVTPNLKRAAQGAVESHASELNALSQFLHDNPETGWKEVRSSAEVARVLSDFGFDVIRGYAGLDTAIRASYGSGPFTVGLIAEYDALPGLGHACGHNLIAAIAVGAALALSRVADVAGLRVVVYGTPAEEGGGGKIELLERGAFTELDLAMMAHPAPVDVAEASPLAVSHWNVEYVGTAAHAATSPTRGINAADAFTIAQVAIGMLRQQLPSTVLVHGVVTHGGDAPNVIPERTEGRWYVRAPSLTELADVEPRVRNCFEAGALATGCELRITPESKPYSEFRHDRAALEFYKANAIALRRTLQESGPATQMALASTDMGNVSQIVPAIHPYIGVGSYPVLNHQKEFADHCVGPIAEQTLHDGAIGLAWTALDMAGRASAHDRAAKVSEHI